MEVTKEFYDGEEYQIKAAVVAEMTSSQAAAANGDLEDNDPPCTPQEYHE
jgi:hypothetical protein